MSNEAITGLLIASIFLAPLCAGGVLYCGFSETQEWLVLPLFTIAVLSTAYAVVVIFLAVVGLIDLSTAEVNLK